MKCIGEGGGNMQSSECMDEKSRKLLADAIYKYTGQSGILDRYVLRKEDDKLIDLISKEKVCVISGKAGMGKTSMISYVTRKLEKYAIVKDSVYEFTTLKSIIQSCDKGETLVVFLDGDNPNLADLVRWSKKLTQDNDQIRIVISTRENSLPDIGCPVILLKTFNRVQTMQYLKLTTNLSDDYAEVIWEYTNGFPLLLALVAGVCYENNISLDKFLEILSETEIKEQIQGLVISKKSTAKTTGDAREVLFQVIHLGPIDVEKLTEWNKTKSIDDIIQLLKENGYVTICENCVYNTPKDMKFSDLEKKRYTYALADVFIGDKEGKIKSEEDIQKVAYLLADSDVYCEFVTEYYKKQVEVIKQSDEHEITRKLILSLFAKTQDSISIIGDKVDQVAATIDSFQQKIIEDIDKIRNCQDANADITSKLDQLVEIVKNPKKRKREVASEILGVLGSVASIASLFDATGLVQRIMSLF